MTYLLRLKIFLSFITLIFLSGGLTMTYGEELFLDDKPIRDEDKLTTLELFSEEKSLGTEVPIKKTYEGDITIGKWQVMFLSQNKSVISDSPIIPDRSKWDLYRVYIPYTIHEAGGTRYYHKVKIQFNFTTKTATAFDLLPKEVLLNEEINSTWTISPEGKFEKVEAKIGELGETIRFNRLIPIIKVFGIGENVFSWSYESQKQQKVIPGTKYALIILEVPKGTKNVSGTIYCEALLAKSILGEFREKESKTDSYLFNLDLSKTKK